MNMMGKSISCISLSCILKLHACMVGCNFCISVRKGGIVVQLSLLLGGVCICAYRASALWEAT